MSDDRADTIALPGARAVFTTRRGGVSEGPYASLNLGLLTDDDHDRVRENRRRAAEAAGVGVDEVAFARQVHGTTLLEWDAPGVQRGGAGGGAAGTGSEAATDAPAASFGGAAPAADPPEADGHATDRAGLALLVFVADCFPVALSDGSRAAMLHCGWRPLAGGILEQALDGFDTTPAAAVGPGIGGCCYEVGQEVLDAFAHLPDVAAGRMLDLRAVIARTLERAGVTEIRHVDRCTSCQPDRYFSHRRDAGVTGRQAGMVVLDG